MMTKIKDSHLVYLYSLLSHLVEERLILYLLLKAMTKDSFLMNRAYELCLTQLKDILERGKNEIRDLIKLVLATLVQEHDKGREIYEYINSVIN
jgi:hypothetical protein